VKSPSLVLRAAGIALAVLAAPASAIAALRVVTTTEDLAALAREVGGARVSVDHLARGYEDPHYVDARPSFVLKLAKADVFIQVGCDLEIGWIPPLLTNARNARILPGGRGFLDVSAGVHILEIPSGLVSRAHGDVHPQGNPHYWLDPENVILMSRSIRDKFAAADHAGVEVYREQQAAFEARLRAAMTRWRAAARTMGLTGAKIATYHNSWPYFAKAFGVNVVGFVEPRPGIPPSASHTAQLIALIRQQNVRALILEPYKDKRLPAKIAREAGCPLVVLPSSVDEKGDLPTYLALVDKQLALLGTALGGR
jgi:zinc/manganese transport system substrate-binding protein